VSLLYWALGIISCGIAAGVLLFASWMVKLFTAREDLLPPPDRAAERSAYSWKEDVE